MKTKIITAVLAIALLASTAIAAGPLTGITIALDAGHGGTEIGAYNATWDVAEKDINLDVVYALKAKLEASGASIVLTREGDETLSSRRGRVNLATERCKAVSGEKCNALISVHHNGSTDNTHDGTLVIYNEKKDIPLATAIHDTLIAGLGLNDEGYLHGGYGMTVYGNTVSALTEGYYVTNDWEAEQYLLGNRVDIEAQAIHDGIINYFSTATGGNGGGPGNGKGRNK